MIKMLKFENFSTRSIELKDKNCIMQWRNSERVRSNMYSDHIISQQEHESWFRHALVDQSASFLIFLFQERPVGFISFTNINHIHGRCTWAFYLGEIDVPRGTGSAMEFFALYYAFVVLEIRKLCCEVFAFNTGVIKLHEKFGFANEGRLVEHYIKNDKYEDVVCLAKFGVKWIEERKNFSARCFGKEGL